MPPTSAAVIAEALPTSMPFDQHGPLLARDPARAVAKTVTLRCTMCSVSYMAEQGQVGQPADNNRVRCTVGGTSNRSVRLRLHGGLQHQVPDACHERVAEHAE